MSLFPQPPRWTLRVFYFHFRPFSESLSTDQPSQNTNVHDECQYFRTHHRYLECNVLEANLLVWWSPCCSYWRHEKNSTRSCSVLPLRVLLELSVMVEGALLYFILDWNHSGGHRFLLPNVCVKILIFRVRLTLLWFLSGSKRKMLGSGLAAGFQQTKRRENVFCFLVLLFSLGPRYYYYTSILMARKKVLR